MASEEDEVAKLTEEQKLQRRMDEQNMQIQILMQGDRENFPVSFIFNCLLSRRCNPSIIDCWRYCSSKICLYADRNREGDFFFLFP
jgi:hypothetical protein